MDLHDILAASPIHLQAEALTLQPQVSGEILCRQYYLHHYRKIGFRNIQDAADCLFRHYQYVYLVAWFWMIERNDMLRFIQPVNRNEWCHIRKTPANYSATYTASGQIEEDPRHPGLDFPQCIHQLKIYYKYIRL